MIVIYNDGAWAGVEIEKSARFILQFKERSIGFCDGLDLCVYGKVMLDKQETGVTQNFVTFNEMGLTR